VLVVVLPVVGWALWMLITAAVAGAIIGGLARLVIPGRQNIGVFNTVVIGWIGSLFGSLIGRHLFHVGYFLTVLCEIALAAILVAAASSGAGNYAWPMASTAGGTPAHLDCRTDRVPRLRGSRR
jgi:uncharacterized membrane protein YeaQ/YmgE (transglycosylase-associated protein family)